MAPPEGSTTEPEWQFSVRYTQEDNFVEYVRVIIDGTEHDMSTLEQNFPDGQLFTYTHGPFSGGTHTYSFKASARTKECEIGPFYLYVEGPPGPSALSVNASPSSIECDGVSTSTITAVVTDGSGNPLPDITVTFSSNGFPGIFSGGSGAPTRAQDDVTNASGVASVQFRPTSVGTARISATAAGMSGSTFLEVSGSGNIKFTIGIIKLGDTQYKIRVQVRYRATNAPVTYENLTLSTSYGNLRPIASGEPHCNRQWG